MPAQSRPVAVSDRADDPWLVSVAEAASKEAEVPPEPSVTICRCWQPQQWPVVDRTRGSSKR